MLTDLLLLLLSLGLGLLLLRRLAGAPSPLAGSWRQGLVGLVLAQGAGLLAVGALLATGLVAGTHRIDPRRATEIGPGVFRYQMRPEPAIARLTLQDTRVIGQRTAVYDSRGPLGYAADADGVVPAPEGRATVFKSTLHVAPRDAAAFREGRETLVLHGSLRPNARSLWPALILLTLGFWLRRRLGVADGVAPAPARLAPLVAGGALALAGLAMLVGPLAGRGILPLQFGLVTAPSPGLLLLVPLGLLLLALLPWRGGSLAWFQRRQGAVPGLVAVLAAAVLLPALGLAEVWSLAGSAVPSPMPSMHVLGVQISDALGYVMGTQELLGQGVLNEWNSRRPLTATLLTLRRMLVGPDLGAILLIGALALGLTLALAAREVARLAGLLGAAVFALAVAAFALEWVPTTMSETTGLAVGLLALGALLAAFRRDDPLLYALGIAALATGLMARAGPVLALPLLLLAVPLQFAWQRRWRQGGLWLAAGVAGTLVGLMTSPFLVATLDGLSSQVQGNFSYTLYGLAVGGKGWSQVLKDHPQLFDGSLPGPAEPRIYALAFEIISNDPGTLVRTVLRELLLTPDYLLSLIREAPAQALWPLGALACLFRPLKPLSALVLAVIAGAGLSSPVIYVDGGTRVYAVVVPVFALAAALGFDMLRRAFAALASEKDVARAALAPFDRPHPARGPLVREPAALGVAALAGLVLAAPLLIAPAINRATAAQADASLPACRDGQQALRVDWANRVVFARVAPGSFEGREDGRVSHQAFLAALAVRTPRFREAMAAMNAPYAVVSALPVGEASRKAAPNLLLAVPDGLLDAPARGHLCGRFIGETDAEIVGRLKVMGVTEVR